MDEQNQRFDFNKNIILLNQMDKMLLDIKTSVYKICKLDLTQINSITDDIDELIQNVEYILMNELLVDIDIILFDTTEKLSDDNFRLSRMFYDDCIYNSLSNHEKSSIKDIISSNLILERELVDTYINNIQIINKILRNSNVKLSKRNIELKKRYQERLKSL
jgi:bacterioferritin (cytochrome b1)